MENLNIKIIGLGEGGAHAISKMIAAGVGKNNGVEFIAIGNDENVMLTSSARKNIFLNRDITTIYKNITDALGNTKLIFLVGGLGSNAARASVPIIISRAKNCGAVIVAFVCKPFVLENSLRKNNAEYTFTNMLGNVDTLFSVPVEKFFVFRINQPQVSLTELFDVADDIFCNGVEIFLNMIAESDSSLALLKWGNAAFGYGEGETALTAIKVAARFPTLESNDIADAEGIFVRLIGGRNLSSGAVELANNFIRERLRADAEFFSQVDTDKNLGDKIFASIILTRKLIRD